MKGREISASDLVQNSNFSTSEVYKTLHDNQDNF